MTNTSNNTRNENDNSKKQFICLDLTNDMLDIMNAVNRLKVDGSKKDEKETLDYIKSGIETIVDNAQETIKLKHTRHLSTT
jgi:hypothetical protein